MIESQRSERMQGARQAFAKWAERCDEERAAGAREPPPSLVSPAEGALSAVVARSGPDTDVPSVADGSRILLVDDDPAVLRAHARTLARAGFRVDVAIDGGAALEALRRASYAVVFSDIDMPGMNGMQLLRSLRGREPGVPVVMITGGASLQTAIEAVEHGALRYLTKPVESGALVRVAQEAVGRHRLERAKGQALEMAGGLDRVLADVGSLEATFASALASLHIAYQPIVSWSTRSVFAYEALLRSREPRLPDPPTLIRAAERLGRVHELGRCIRAKAIEPLPTLAGGAALFLNLHPDDLLDPCLYDSRTPLAGVASRVVLEITERASLDAIPDVRTRIAALRELGFRIAIDDLGAGYAGLTSFVLLEPDVVKLDMGLIRDVDRDPTRQVLVRTMVSMSRELGVTVLGEGIETGPERDALAGLGCDLMQGYLFARPCPAFVTPRF